MNKLIKSAIAAAAAMTLLLGGAGTFAQWNSNISVAAGTVSSGTMTVTLVGTPVWTDVSPGKTAKRVNLSTFRMVPGDKLRLVQRVRLKATGNNLKAHLRFDLSKISTGVDGSLGGAMVPTFTATGPAVKKRVDPWTFSVVPTTSETTVRLIGTLTLPAVPVGPQTAPDLAQTGTLDLTGLQVELTQVR